MLVGRAWRTRVTNSYSKLTLDERIQMGWHSSRIQTAADGTAQVSLPELDGIEDPHHRVVRVIARFQR